MGSSNLKSDLYDPVRQKWVKETPEERIRQGWIKKMVEELGFPLSLLSVEKELSTLPHLSHLPLNAIPRRRIDIVAFAKGIWKNTALFPLLMIECKAVPLTPQFAEQVIGYNDSVQAPFIAIANHDQILTGRYDPQKRHFSFKEGLSNYSELLKHLVKDEG